MSRGQWAFNIIIRCVFILAFGAFLSASIHHIAVFFQNFEPPTADQSVSWGSYALAISVDGTALILTIGMMFFSQGMPGVSKVIVWAFIIALTVFSWVVNWEYAVAYQTPALTDNLVSAWKNINPVLASSFAFLNLAYSVVSEFFGTKEKTLEELRAELDGLTGERATLRKQIDEAKGPDFIDRAKEAALKAKKAAVEVLAKEEDTQPKTEMQMEVIASSDGSDRLEQTIAFLQRYPDATDEEIAEYLGMKRPASARFWRLKAGEILTLNRAQKTEVKMERITSPLTDNGGNDAGKEMEVEVEETMALFEEVPEELYDGTSTDASEAQTDPEVEVIDVASVPSSGSDSGNKTSTGSIATRRKPMTISEVARELECSERHVRGLRAQGKLLEDEADKNLIKAASVRAYKSSKRTKVS